MGSGRGVGGGGKGGGGGRGGVEGGGGVGIRSDCLGGKIMILRRHVYWALKARFSYRIETRRCVWVA